MKRTALKRHAPMERGEPIRARRWGTKPAPKKPSWRDQFMPARMAPREPALSPFARAYLKWVRTLDCRARWIPGHRCRGRMTAHHAGRKPGASMLAAHVTAIPLCWRAHLEGIEILGDVFKGWKREKIRDWEDDQIREVQRLAIPEDRQQAEYFEALGLGEILNEVQGCGWAWHPFTETTERAK